MPLGDEGSEWMMWPIVRQITAVNFFQRMVSLEIASVANGVSGGSKANKTQIGELVWQTREIDQLHVGAGADSRATKPLGPNNHMEELAP